MKYRIRTCDSSFVGNLAECREWFESDSFSPKIPWFELINRGRYDCGFPWGEVTLEVV